MVRCRQRQAVLVLYVGGAKGDGARRFAAHSQQSASCARNRHAVELGIVSCAMRDFGAGADADDETPGEFDLGESGVATHSIPACSAFKVRSL